MSKPKPVNWSVDQSSDGPFTYLADLITKYHSDVQNVHCIALWRDNVKPDQDGVILLADISKSPDKFREIYPHDFIIGVNRAVWGLLDDCQRKIVLDSQLERIAVSTDKDGNPREDDRSRAVYRLKKTQTVDNETIISRHGFSLDDIHEFVCEKLGGDVKDGSYAAGVLSN